MVRKTFESRSSLRNSKDTQKKHMESNTTPPPTEVVDKEESSSTLKSTFQSNGTVTVHIANIHVNIPEIQIHAIVSNAIKEFTKDFVDHVMELCKKVWNTRNK